MNENILNELVNKILDTINIWEIVKWLFLTILPALLKCFGISSENIQRFIGFIGFTKNRRACKYVILSKVDDDCFEN